MEIIESYIEGKLNNKKCDDGLFINEKFIAVIDGVTSKGKLLWNGMKSGEFAKEIIYKELDSLDEQIDAYNAIERLNEAIRKSYGDNYEIAKKQVEERISATIIIFSKFKNEIWIFGDCQCLVNGKYFNNPKVIDKILAEVRSLYIGLEMLNGKNEEDIRNNDTGRNYILPLIKETMKYANNYDSEYGYNVLDGFKINSEKCVIIKTSPKDEIVLASDGYPVLKPTLKESEDTLKEIIEKDSLGIKLFKSTKGLVTGNNSFDDRTYIRFIV